MKQYRVKGMLLALLLSSLPLYSVSCRDSCDVEHISKTHLSVRPHFQSHSPELLTGFRHDRLYARPDGKNAAVQLVAYGSKSSNEDELARYFMPFGKQQVRVTSINTILLDGQRGDILSDHFNIQTPSGKFDSIVSFAPKQSVLGLGMHLRKSFWREDDHGFYASMSMPLERIKNDMGLCERIIDDGTTGDYIDALDPDGFERPTIDPEKRDFNIVANMTEAFVQKEWKFGKIGCDAMTQVGIGDIEFKLGYEWLNDDPCFLDGYIGLLAPAGTQGNRCFVWNPVVGHGKHFGLFSGGTYGRKIWESDESDAQWNMEVSLHTQYLFRKTHCRSLDLKCKPWSRYIEMYEDQAQAVEADELPSNDENNGFGYDEYLATPGINILTLPVCVTPGFSHNVTSAFIFDKDQLHAEFGYNLYCRQAECVKLAQPFTKRAAIKSRDGDGNTSPNRTMGTNRIDIEYDNGSTDIEGSIKVDVARYENTIIKACDLDLNSAATPFGISHTLYGSIGYRWDERDRPAFITLGGSYEAGKATNGMLDRWTFWLKGGLSL